MITIDFEKGKFRISCLPYEAGVVASLPNRRFNKHRGIWVAPVVRLNVEAIDRMACVKTPDALFAIQQFEGKGFDTLEPFPKSYRFKTEPRDYQRRALDKVYPLKCSGLFKDVGTGKTKVAIDNAAAHFLVGHIKKVLVVCLVSIKRNWLLEIEKHCPVSTVRQLVETGKAGQKRFKEFNEAAKGQFAWTVVGIESFSAGKAFSMVESIVDEDTLIIVDESSSIKSYKAARTEKAVALGAKAGYRMIMTGTPVTQGAGDLFSQFEFLDPNIIGVGTYYSFRNRYCIMGGHEGRQIIGYQNMDELTSTIAPYIFQARKRDVLKELPPFSYKKYEVELTKEQTGLYKELKKRMRIQYESKKLVVKNTMNMMQRFSEITGGNISYEVENKDPLTNKKRPIIYQQQPLKKSPKLDELMSILGYMAEDEPVVIWAEGKAEVLQIIEAVAKKYGMNLIGQVHGGIKEGLRHEYVEAFQAGELRFIIGNPAVGGIGLNMTAAATMIFFDRSFSLQDAIQSEGRIDRIGQVNPITYIDIVCKGTIDEYILKALKNKLDFAEMIRSSFDSGSLLEIV